MSSYFVLRVPYCLLLTTCYLLPTMYCLLLRIYPSYILSVILAERPKIFCDLRHIRWGGIGSGTPSQTYTRGEYGGCRYDEHNGVP
jgi:hypothetical protein